MNLRCFFSHDIGEIGTAFSQTAMFRILECSRCKKRWAQIGDSGWLRITLERAKEIAAEQGGDYIFAVW